jgi:hypothetical protein
MIIIASAAVVMASAIAVIFTVVVVSIQSEDRHALPHQAPTLIDRGVRRLTGLHVSPAQEAGQLPRTRTGKVSHRGPGAFPCSRRPA